MEDEDLLGYSRVYFGRDISVEKSLFKVKEV